MCGGVQCDLKKGHGGEWHGNGDPDKGRIGWGVVRRKPKPITDDCEECGGTGTVEVECEDCGTPLTDKNWKAEYETYSHAFSRASRRNASTRNRRRAVAKVLTEDEVLQLVAQKVGDPGDDAIVKLAKSHEALRHELERVRRLVDVAVVALGKLRKEAL